MGNNEMSGTLPDFLGHQVSLFSLLVNNNNFRCAGGLEDLLLPAALFLANLLGCWHTTMFTGMLMSL